MKKIFSFPLFFTFCLGCHNKESSKEIATDFILNVAQFKFTEAEKLVSENTKNNFFQAQKNILKNPELYEAKNSDGDGLREVLKLDSLGEEEKENEASVYNSLIKISLIKDHQKWKVDVNENLIKNILFTANRKRQLLDQFILLSDLYEKKYQFIRDVVFVIKKKKITDFDFFGIDSFLLLKPNVVMSLAKTEMENYIEYYQKLQNKYSNILLQIDNSELVKSDVLDNLKLKIEVQDKRIKIALYDYNQLAKMIDPSYVLIIEPINQENNVEF